MPARTVRLIVFTAAVAASAMAVGCTPAAPAPSPETGTQTQTPETPVDPAEHADAFLDEWVEEGRVIRRDEGGDTVSEGQAYGLLAAVAAEDEQAFDEIWQWTSDELLRDDGLLAWRWDDGEIVDDEPASDAELDAARALVLAGDRFDRDDLTQDGLEMSDALLDNLTEETPFGLVLLPGLWAGGDEPLPYNPSYASPAAYDLLGEATGDERWGQLSQGSRAVTEALFEVAELPPDWAQIDADGTVSPMDGPLGEGKTVRYGFDAQRTLIRYAEACDAEDRALITGTREALSYSDEPAAELDLGGGALTDDRSPLSIIARAAAAAADGDDVAAEADLARAGALSGDVPTYYGRAWVMLGHAMLQGDLGGCAVIGAGAP